MKKTAQYLTFIILLPLVLITNDSLSLPSSLFMIGPSGIKNSVYSQEHSLFRIETPDEDFTFPESANQKTVSLERKNGKTVILLQTGRNPVTSANSLSSYLKNTPFLNTDRQDIKKAADKFKNSKDPLKDIAVFVYKHISDKKVGIPMVPASSILKQRSGDCTEHSVLAVALMRSLNIPARAVVGLILAENFGGKKNVFVYHMWVEAYKNGRWEMIDATRPRDVHPNRYIALAYHNLMTETPLEFLTAASAVNDMKILYVK